MGVDVLASVLAVAQGSGAISAIVEDGYHDPDYRHEYWRHYSRVFAPPVAVTKRIHFFAEPAKELVDLNDDELVLRADLDYVGYSVIRPVGRGRSAELFFGRLTISWSTSPA